GAHVGDLKSSDFKVFIGEKEAEIVSLSADSGPLNVVLFVDTSPSATFKQDYVRSVAETIAEQFGPDDKLMVMQFNSELKVLSEPNSDRTITKQAIGKLKTGDGTSLYDMVKAAFETRICSMEGRTAVFLITDGVDTTSRKAKYSTSLEAVENCGATVYPVYLDTFPNAFGNVGRLPGSMGINDSLQTLLDNLRRNGQLPNPSKGEMTVSYERGRLYLNDMVFASGGRAFKADKVAEKPAVVAEEARSRYFLTVKLASPLKAGERLPVRVRVARPGLGVMARGSYIPR
ncbi:MAG TPA: VWA domain-containing protein, partial [Pyrinomonadaceae bacterium]|nr:VWA domain-containing protein [Pyrinomonadaceae bacterium]